VTQAIGRLMRKGRPELERLKRRLEQVCDIHNTEVEARICDFQDPFTGVRVPARGWRYRDLAKGIVTGLTNITVSLAPNEISGWATLQITAPATLNVISNYVPADAIVIPANATGIVQIILESSPDLLNWSAANPGIYAASSATNRFFRVRAVHN
jgi:hypothetical protein